MQAILVFNVVFKLGIEVDEEFALALAGLLETSYQISRAWSSRVDAFEIANERTEQLREQLTAEVTAAVVVALRAQPAQQIVQITPPATSPPPAP